MPVKVGKGKKGKKGSKGKKKKGKKGSKGKKKKGKKAPAKLKKIAGELSTDQLLQYQIMKEDRTALQKRAKDSEDKISILDKKLHQINEDQTDIFENLRSKVEKSRAYAKVLLDQRDVLEREKKDSIEALESQLEKKAAQLRGKRNQLKMLKERWNEQQGRMQSAAQTLAVRASMEENARRLEKELEETKSINHLRESQNAIISSITEHAEIKAVAAMLLECLKQFPSLVVVQRESIQSLTKILNLKNCDLVIESGGIEMIIHAIREHRHDVTLLAACCRLMWRLYVDADHRKVCHLFAKHNARDEVLTSLQNHPSDRHLHYNVVGILNVCWVHMRQCFQGTKTATTTTMTTEVATTITEATTTWRKMMEGGGRACRAVDRCRLLLLLHLKHPVLLQAVNLLHDDDSSSSSSTPSPPVFFPPFNMEEEEKEEHHPLLHGVSLLHLLLQLHLVQE